MKIKYAAITLSGLMTVPFLTGCSSIIRGTPQSATVINANMDKTDIEVGTSTEGTTTRTSILFGLIQVIDGDKYRLLGMNFFEDQYAFTEKKDTFYSMPVIGMFLSSVNVEDRAYYKALAGTPDADTIVPKAFVTTKKAFLGLYDTESVTYQGKAIKYKSHQ